jgi:hypothetical protein
MKKISRDTILDIAKYLTDFKCNCSIHFCLTPLLINIYNRDVIIGYLKDKKEKILNEKCYKKRQFINDLINTRVFNKSYPENYGFPSGALGTLISQLFEWKCMTHPPKDIIISETGRIEWWGKIKRVCRNLANANSLHPNIRKTATLHADTPQELTQLLKLMVKFGLTVKYRYHNCCSDKGIMWEL